MDQREHVRIQVPLAVELTHAALGAVKTVARDISEGGLFVLLRDHGLHSGAQLKVKVLNTLDSDTQPTPTIDMRVARVAEDGLGLQCTNKTSSHLLASVERLREELSIGRDYFQVYQSIVLHLTGKGVLLLQRNGKWFLPGHYLVVGEDAEDALARYLHTELGVRLTEPAVAVARESLAGEPAPESATFRVTLSGELSTADITLADGSDIKDHRWVIRPRELHEITFASEAQRTIAAVVLDRLLENTSAP